MKNYKLLNSFEKRLNDSSRILKLYPDRVPVIIEKSDIDFSKYKYLVSKDMNLSHFYQVLRNKTSLDKTEALYIFVNNKLIKQTELMVSVYNTEKDEDGFLYVIVKKEATFG